MHDIRLIREDPARFDAGLSKRGVAPQSAHLIGLDDTRREAVQALQDLETRRNQSSKEIGKAKGQGDEVRAQALMDEVASIKEALHPAQEQVRNAENELTAALEVLPNLPLDEVPFGEDEDANVEHRQVGEKPRLDGLNKPKEHFELGEAIGGMDFERAARLSGARFTVLSGKLARLERALQQFMLDLHTNEHGYTEVATPLLVRDEVLYGTGQLPKFEEDLFKTTDGRWLIPTAEVTLTNLVREETLAEAELPLRFTAATPCFRSEAGSAGRDVRGMLRQHQFEKVELVSITTPETSLDEHERMTACAEEVLKRLGLHYRIMVLSSGDMGFGAQKTYDLEVWLPGQNAFREISSCSVCGDFQARRMNARYRPAEGKGLQFVHTLNGSGVAVGRALIAVLENYQNADGSVSIPEVLQPYMGGMERIAA